MYLLLHNAPAVIPFLMVDEDDHIAGKTGLAPVVTVSKAGGAFGSAPGVVTEVGNGWYRFVAEAGAVDTLGGLAFHATAAGADPTDLLLQVVAFDPGNPDSLGLAHLDMPVSLVAAGAGAGAWVLTVTVRDDDETPVPGAGVTVRNAAGTAILRRGTTGPAGTATFNLDDGDYQLLASSLDPMLSLPGPQAVEIDGADTAAIIEAERQSVAEPGAPELCAVFGTLRRKDGEPAAGVPVAFQLVGDAPYAAAGAVIVVESVTATTDAAGFFSVNLTRSVALTPLLGATAARYKVTAPAARLQHLFSVPDQASADLAEIDLVAVG